MGQMKPEEFERLKKELFERKEAVAEIKQLVKEEIERDFHIDPWELSPRELDALMAERLTFLNDDIDTRPDATVITSHRKILGKPIVWVKRIFMRLTRFYTNALLEKQRHFNGQLVAFHLASFIRCRHIEKRLQEIEERMAAFEDRQELLSQELKEGREAKGK